MQAVSRVVAIHSAGQAVIAVAGDEESGPIVAAGQYVAACLDLNCHLISVIEPLMEAYADFNFTPLAEVNAQYVEQARHQVDARLSRLADAAVVDARPVYHITVGRPASAIAALAAELDAELVVMGMHQRHGLQRLLGSTTRVVSNMYSGNLLAVHPRQQALPYRRILVAVDTTPIGSSVLQAAHKLDRPDLRFRVLSVCMPFASVLPVPQPAKESVLSGLPVSQLESDLIRNVTRTIRTRACGVGYELQDVTVSSGHPADAIVEAASGMRADLIVLGAASRSRVGRLLLGSTAHAVLNLAPCDVLLVGQDTMKQNEETG